MLNRADAQREREVCARKTLCEQKLNKVCKRSLKGSAMLLSWQVVPLTCKLSRLLAICPYSIRFGTWTPVPLACHFSISHTLWYADARLAYLPFVHFPHALARGPPSCLPAICPFPIQVSMLTTAVHYMAPSHEPTIFPLTH